MNAYHWSLAPLTAKRFQMVEVPALGSILGDWTVISGRVRRGENTWCITARCKCGTVRVLQIGNLLRGKTTRCAACRAAARKYPRSIDRNLPRVYVTKEERRMLVEELMEAGASRREIADRFGVHVTMIRLILMGRM